ncbi:UDP-N-acetylmuramoyl-L-alanyl-D-glutamate--2,6-diaminopimelate ligase [Corynebacterium choanae]|uniref:UDP-N-acetylmuramoyl-L-alanyl-D-glutamate--2,6-diaminopimelate ligase n=1 Tax=Corynebacterium choanae TaxID=1862358 RepID=A0A3G6J851_9CORY|nr:UDP-N-acetylmuramoyl-L-alanyl-D-glutamate--2,6-diaminopimelate ligase [Corynebacterium choanae]AZA13953.1 UDP-N-acetylmuramoyl-L-alanyl-D-glutamate--2,6-diaminopimelate ligase [Corynebacterium choanae]
MTSSLDELAVVSGATLNAGDPDTAGKLRIASVGINAQTLEERSLFAAVPGTRTHGANFAAKSQATAILTDAEGYRILTEAGEKRPVLVVANVRHILGKVASAVYGNPSRELTIIGVTGTAGKTTVVHMLEHALLKMGYAVAMIGTNGTRINGEPHHTELTTPEAPVLQALFRHMVDIGVTHVVMEVSSHALELGRVGGVEFTVGGFTNLSQDHLDFHDTMEEYFAAKAQFFQPGSPVRPTSVVINVDQQWGRRMAVIAGPAAATISLTGAPASQPVTEIVPTAGGGHTFTMRIGETRIHAETVLPGLFNVANAALAMSLAHAAGVQVQQFAEALTDAVVPGRMQPIQQGQDFAVFVDYAHKPAALAAVLDTVADQTQGRIAVVFGAGGDRDHGKRPVMGKEAATRANLVVVTDDNPRSEDPATIRREILAGIHELSQKPATAAKKSLSSAKNRQDKKNGTGLAKKRKSLAEVHQIGDRSAAIAYAIDWANPGDTVIIAGKGHETGQQIGDEVIEFNDVTQAEHAIAQRLRRS